MSITIDCRTCSRRNSSACDDCVVTFILNGPATELATDECGVPDDGVVVDAAEFFALRRLQKAGMVPALRHDGIDAGAG